MTDRSKDRNILLGTIGKPYGLKGECYFYYFGKEPKNLNSYLELFTKDYSKVFQVKALREIKGRVIISFDNIVSRTEIEEYRNKELYISEDQLLDLDEGDFYWYQLESLKVLNLEGDFLGLVSELMETGKNDVLVIKPTKDSIDSKTRLIPYVKEKVINSVDIEIQTITVNWPKEFDEV